MDGNLNKPTTTSTGASASTTSGAVSDATTPSAVTSASTSSTASSATTHSAVRIESLLEECVKRKASDLHIQYGLPPILRIDGALTPIGGLPNLNSDMVRELIFATLDEEQRKILANAKYHSSEISDDDLQLLEGLGLIQRESEKMTFTIRNSKGEAMKFAPSFERTVNNISAFRPESGRE